MSRSGPQLACMPLMWSVPDLDISAVENGNGSVGHPGTMTGVLAVTAEAPTMSSSTPLRSIAIARIRG